MQNARQHLRNTFLAGIFASIPIAVTVFIIAYVEGVTRQPLRDLLGIDTPFLGVVIAIAAIYLLGLMVTSIIGKLMLTQLDRLLLRMPVLKDLYQAWKHVTITPDGKGGTFSRVVLVPVERGNLRTIGFTSGQSLPGDNDTLCVFVPTAPNPTSGRLYFIPRRDCQEVNISPEEAFKLILSTGNYIPKELGVESIQTYHGFPSRAGEVQ